MAVIRVPFGEYRIGHDFDCFILAVTPENSAVIFRSAREKTAGLLNCNADDLDYEKVRAMYSELREGMAAPDVGEEQDSLELVVVSRKPDQVVALLGNLEFSGVEANDLVEETSRIGYDVDYRGVTIHSRTC